MSLYGNLINKGSIVKKVIITKGKGLSEDNGILEIVCELLFSGDKSVRFLLRNSELEDEKYTKGIYEYKNGTYTQIENWD
jgi:hypothetical protein